MMVLEMMVMLLVHQFPDGAGDDGYAASTSIP